jgi:hypothetical protein
MGYDPAPVGVTFQETPQGRQQAHGRPRAAVACLSEIIDHHQIAAHQVDLRVEEKAVVRGDRQAGRDGAVDGEDRFGG